MSSPPGPLSIQGKHSGDSDDEGMSCGSDDEDDDDSTGASLRSNKRQHSPDRAGGPVGAAIRRVLQRVRQW